MWTVVTATAMLIHANAAFAQVPTPWQQADIGDVGLAGDASVATDGTLRAAGAGSDIWGTADSFHFVYESFHDTAEITDKPIQDGANPFAKAGIMIRLTLDPGSPHVILDVKPNGDLEFMTRQTPGGPTTFIAGIPAACCRLKLVRSNGLVTGFVCSYGDASPCQTVGSTPFPSGAALAGVVVTSHDTSTLNHATFGSGLPQVSPLPLPWYSHDVGPVGLAGTAYVDNGTFTITGAGADIWGTSDSFHFAEFQTIGDGEVLARVTAEDAANTYAKAGVMVTPEGTSTANSAVILDIRPNGLIEFMARPSSGAAMQFVAGSAASFPVWLKIERRSNQFTGFMSTDGTQWSVVGTASVSMTGGNMGLAVTSHDKAALNTSTFDHVLVSSANAIDEDLGDVGIAGQFWPAPDDSYFELFGSGADIWGTADAFHWRRYALIDDGQLSVNLGRPQNPDGSGANTFAKFGLMMRASLDPSAAMVILDVRPTGEIEFMARNASGDATTFVAAATATPALFLKLARSGSTITGYMSSDGSMWTTVGSASPSIDSMGVMGVVINSHQRGTLVTGGFSHLSFGP